MVLPGTGAGRKTLTRELFEFIGVSVSKLGDDERESERTNPGKLAAVAVEREKGDQRAPPE